MQVAQNVANRVNQIVSFKELSIGSGSTVILKGNNEGCFSGYSNYTGAPLKWDRAGNFYASKVTITGAINATSGSITGDLSVTGKLIFKSGTTERGRIYADSGGIHLTIGGKGIEIDTFGNVNVPNASLTVYNDITSGHGGLTVLNNIVSQNGTISCVGDITVSSGGVTSNNGMLAPNGSVLVKYNIEAQTGYVKAGDWMSAHNDITSETGSVFATLGEMKCKFDITSTYGSLVAKDKCVVQDNNYWCKGSEGDNGTFTDGSGNTITVKGGIITGGL